LLIKKILTNQGKPEKDISNRISDLEMSNFSQDQGKQKIARRRTGKYAAQAILQLDAGIVEKGP